MSACSWRRTKLWIFYSLLANAGRVLMRVKDVCPLTHRAKCLTFISKTLWWFATWLMVSFSEKNTSQRIPVISNNSTPDHRHHSAEKTRLVLMAIPASVNPKVSSKPSRSGVYATAESQQRLNQCSGRKLHSPIPMSGRLATTVQTPEKALSNQSFSSAEFGRRERVEEQAALW